MFDYRVGGRWKLPNLAGASGSTPTAASLEGKKSLIRCGREDHSLAQIVFPPFSATCSEKLRSYTEEIRSGSRNRTCRS